MKRLPLALYAAFVLAVLYLPIAVMAVFSFSASPYSAWTGFTLDWYRRIAEDQDIRSSLANTLILAAASTALASVLGTLGALAARNSFRGKRLYATLVSLPVMVPDIVMAIALLALFRALGVGLSLVTATIAHTTFNLSYVALVVAARLEGMDRTTELAALDLGATPWGAFWKVTFPAILPGILSGALLAFTLSFDDFVITYFTTGPDSSTLPMLIYSKVRFGGTAEMRALSTVLLLASLGLIGASLRISRVPVTGGGR
jgi:spermidine/putrescine transport system permease protein